MRCLVLTICLAVALPAVLIGQTTYDVPLSRRTLSDTAQYHGSKTLAFDKPSAGAITVPPRWAAVEMAVIAENPRLQPAVVVRYQDDGGVVRYAVATDGRMTFDSTSVLSFHSSGDRLFADFLINAQPEGNADTIGRQFACKLLLSNNRVIARLAECREGTLRLGNQDYSMRIYAPSIGNPFFDMSSDAVCLIDASRDGTYSWNWRIDDSDGTVIPSERIALTKPFSVNGRKLRAESIDSAGTVFTCSDYPGDTAAVVGFLAPEFSVADLDGVTYTLANMKGRVVLVTFWSTRCGYCERIRPQLDTLILHCDTTQFQAISAAVDSDTGRLTAFLRERPYGGVVAPYAAPLWNTYNPRRTTPVYYIIDREGSIVFSGVGSSVLSVVERVVSTELSPEEQD